MHACSLRHPCIVSLLGVLEIDNDTFATVLELCDGGDLDGMLREHKVRWCTAPAPRCAAGTRRRHRAPGGLL